MKKTEKTNVMRILDQKKIPYQSYTYSGVISGKEVADILNQPAQRVFKTLVTVGASKNHYVFVVPVDRELDLKKAAKAVSEKNIAMIKQAELLPLTGYIHGGCSPIGMKKLFSTVLDKSAENFDSIFFSAGKIGYQVALSPDDLKKVIPLTLCDITVGK